ncbi:Hsp20/alpha crystallin family protein [Halosolutus amylolyticus]|uniref:Hsp20/alpha crystallin family protein n=1 Tax=Halosolutus amylolyticus TaxID=2932267 RepID=A0ABD5PMK7_9EURY|nr:Hsp20/alpha crystallin family protein [Halosolutus amylolyticus]
MSDRTDDSDDEPADDHRDESEDLEEFDATDESADRPIDGDDAGPGTDESEAEPSESEQDDRDPSEPKRVDRESTEAASGDARHDGDESDRDGDESDRSDDDRRAAPRDPHPHTRAANAGSDDGHWLSNLIDALERLEGSSTSGQRRSDRTVLDYDVSIGTAFDSDDDESAESPFGSRPIDESGESRRDRPRKRRRRNSSTGGHHLTTRTGEDELLVTADVASADPDDVTVGFDDGTLVVAVGDREIDRVDVPWTDRSADATIKNGILTVEVTPGTRSTDEVDDDE